MRDDLHKVFLRHKPKRGGSWSKLRWKGAAKILANTPDEELPSFEAMSSRRYRSRRRNYNVIRHWLCAQAGRPWAQVRSEVCRQNDARNHGKQELRKWLETLVDESVELIDGVATNAKRGYKITGLWVHPETGILMPPLQKKRRYPKKDQRKHVKPSPQQYKIDDGRCLALVEAAWWLITLKPIPSTSDDSMAGFPFDVVLYCVASGHYFWELYSKWGAAVYAASKCRVKDRTVRRYLTPRPKRLSDDTFMVARKPA